MYVCSTLITHVYVFSAYSNINYLFTLHICIVRYVIVGNAVWGLSKDECDELIHVSIDGIDYVEKHNISYTKLCDVIRW